MLVSVVMPCLNEEEAIGLCIEKAQKVLQMNGIEGEVVVCDNGSTDRSAQIAKEKGAVVVHQPIRGYGNAYLKGFSAANGKYIVMIDADDTYDFNLIPVFLDYLQNRNCDFVTGSRYLKGGDKNITLLHRYLGNPALTGILNFLFGTRYTDVYSGYRAFTQEVYKKIQPVSPGMEFNLELAINAGLAGCRVAEIPIQLAPRKGKSKLRTMQDGWRSLRMMLLYCPSKVFVWPGVFLIASGLFFHLASLLGLIRFQGRALETVTSIFAMIFSVVGLQIFVFGLYAKTYSWSSRFDRRNLGLLRFYRYLSLEKGLLLGFLLLVFGGIMIGGLLVQWVELQFMPLPHPALASFAATVMIYGFQIIFSSLFISAMMIRVVRKGLPLEN